MTVSRRSPCGMLLGIVCSTMLGFGSLAWSLARLVVPTILAVGWLIRRLMMLPSSSAPVVSVLIVGWLVPGSVVKLVVVPGVWLVLPVMLLALLTCIAS